MILLCHQTSVHDCLGEDQQLFHSQARRRGSYDKLRNPKGQPGSSSREKSFPKRENSMSGEAVTKPLHGKSACLPIRAYTSLAYLMICERSWRQDRSPWEGEREPDLHGVLEWNRERCFLPHYEASELFHERKIKRLLAGRDVGMMSVLF